MARRFRCASGERLIVSTTPISRGLWRPLLLAAMVTALVIIGGQHVTKVHTYEGACFAVLVGPPLFVALTRTVRWRSHKIHVTSERIVDEAGVLRVRSRELRHDEVLSVEVEQRLKDKVRRRGTVWVRSRNVDLPLGPLRHPESLVRLVDQARRGTRPSVTSYDTVFEPRVSFDEWPRPSMPR